jgi:hypothetical protein
MGRQVLYAQCPSTWLSRVTLDQQLVGVSLVVLLSPVTELRLGVEHVSSLKTERWRSGIRGLAFSLFGTSPPQLSRYSTVQPGRNSTKKCRPYGNPRRSGTLAWPPKSAETA